VQVDRTLRLTTSAAGANWAFEPLSASKPPASPTFLLWETETWVTPSRCPEPELTHLTWIFMLCWYWWNAGALLTASSDLHHCEHTRRNKRRADGISQPTDRPLFVPGSSAGIMGCGVFGAAAVHDARTSYCVCTVRYFSRVNFASHLTVCCETVIRV
jgi:hypothetical protein